MIFIRKTFIALLEFGGTCLMFKTSVYASRKLFNRFLLKLFQLSLSFFEQTPVGQIINRCSSDFDMIDNNLMFTLRSTLNAILGFIICSLVIANFLPKAIPIMIMILILFVCLEVKKKAEKNH